MIECEVSAVFNAKGQPRPTKIIWEATELMVESLGRHWVDDDGQHLLARVRDGRVFELVYNAVIWRGKVLSSPPQFI